MLEWIWYLRSTGQFIACALLFVFATFRGEMPERLLAGIMLAASSLDFGIHGVLQLLDRKDLLTQGHLTLDIGLFAAILAVAMRANRTYPLWLGGAQIIALVAHLFHSDLLGTKELTYALMHRAPFYIQILALTIGLSAHVRRTRQGLQNYPSWSA